MTNKTGNTSIVMDLGQGLSLMFGFPNINCWEGSERPEDPKRGTFGFNLQTKSLEFYDGSDWYIATMDKG